MRSIVVLAACILLTAGSAVAEVDCASSCPSGQVKISYSDGNHVTCDCVAAGSGMQPNAITEDDMDEDDIPQEGDS